MGPCFVGGLLSSNGFMKIPIEGPIPEDHEIYAYACG